MEKADSAVLDAYKRVLKVHQVSHNLGLTEFVPWYRRLDYLNQSFPISGHACHWTEQLNQIPRQDLREKLIHWDQGLASCQAIREVNDPAVEYTTLSTTAFRSGKHFARYLENWTQIEQLEVGYWRNYNFLVKRASEGLISWEKAAKCSNNFSNFVRRKREELFLQISVRNLELITFPRWK